MAAGLLVAYLIFLAGMFWAMRQPPERFGKVMSHFPMAAMVQFKEAIKHRPLSAEAHLSLGQALNQLGDKEAGASELAEADRLNRRTADAQASTFAVSVGVRKVKAGDYRGGIEQFREAIRLAEDNPQAHYQLALALRHTGARAEAQTHFETAHRLAPYLNPPDDDKR